MKLTFTNKPSKNSVKIYPVFHKEKVKNASMARLAAKLAAAKEFEGKEDQIFFSFSDKTLLIGLGDPKKLNTASVMSAFGGAAKSSQRHRPKNLAVVLNEALFPFAQAIIEAVALANYQPDAPFKTGKRLSKLKEQKIETVEIVGAGNDKSVRAAIQKGLAISNAVNDARDWVNAPPNYGNAKFFDETAKKIAGETGAKLTILKNKELEKLNMGALLGVNRGSPEEARLIILDYCPKDVNEKDPPLIFVGKGIIFDSGGYNLKPSGHLEDMQSDKAGGSAVLALVKILPKLGIKKRVIAIAPFTENLIGSHAQRPSEIVKTYSGKTIEITNTDAEGRLVLVDAISYAIDKYKPEFIVDLATLTGACVVAIGNRYSGLFGNDDDLQKRLREAGDEVDDLLWPLPLHKDYEAKMKGQFADLWNADTGTERGAGASKGAAFIKEFVGKTKWAHLDIAGPAFTNEPKAYEQKGATGCGVRLLARFLEKL